MDPLDTAIPSVVPGRVSFSIDVRHPYSAVLARLGDDVPAICRRNAGACAVTITRLTRAEDGYVVQAPGRAYDAMIYVDSIGPSRGSPPGSR